MSKINLTLPILMIVNGLFFISNIYVLGDTQAALAMHGDLPARPARC
jgi:hypothetical protein